MRKLTKRLLSLLVVMAMVAAMVPTTGLPAVEVKATEQTVTSVIPEAEQAKIDHAAELAGLTVDELDAIVKGTTCPMCGAKDITWTRREAYRWDDPAANSVNHWYINTQDSFSSWTYTEFAYNGATNVKTCIVMIDAGIDNNHATGRGFGSIMSGAVLNIMGTGTVTIAGGNVFGVAAGGEVNLYGGTYIYDGTSAVTTLDIDDGGVVNVYNDTVIGAATQEAAAYGNVSLTDGGILNMYGGTIRNGKRTEDFKGGNINVARNSFFNMYGGTVTGGSTGRYGGNVYVEAGSTAKIYGGEISNGSATYYGGNLTTFGGTVQIYGGNFIGGTAYGGGNIAAPRWDHGGTDHGESTFTITGGTFIGGNATTYRGGNLLCHIANPTITGATFENGTAGAWGGNMFFDDSCGTVTLGENVVVKNGTAPTGSNLALHYKDTLKVEGAEIIGNSANVHISASKIVVDDGIIGNENGVNINCADVEINGGYFYGNQTAGNNTYGKSITCDNGKLIIRNATIAGDVSAIGSDLTLGGTVILKTSITLPDGSVKVGYRGIELGIEKSLNIDELSSDSYISFANESGTPVFATSTNAANMAQCFVDYKTGGYTRASGNNLVLVAPTDYYTRDCAICGKTQEYFAVWGTTNTYATENCDHYALGGDATAAAADFADVAVLHLNGKTLTLSGSVSISKNMAVIAHKGGTVAGTLVVDGCTLTVAGNANFEKLQVVNGGQIIFKNWAGTATLEAPIGDDGVISGVTVSGTYEGTLTHATTGKEINVTGDKLVTEAPFSEKCPVCGKVEWEVFDGTTNYAGITEHKHFYLADHTTYDGTLVTGNMITLGAGGSVCFNLNGYTLTMVDAHFWLTTLASEESMLNIIANGGAINYSNRALIQQNRGSVSIYGGKYTATGTEDFVALASRYFLLEDATVNGNLTSQNTSTKFVLSGNTKVGKINLAQGGKVEIKPDWTGNATLDMTAAELENGVVPTDKVSYNSEFAGTLKLATDETLIFVAGQLMLDPVNTESVIPADAQLKIAEAAVIANKVPSVVIAGKTCPMCGETVTWTPLEAGVNVAASAHAHYYITGAVHFTDSWAIKPGANSQVCIVLNNAEVTSDGPFIFGNAAGATVNIMGKGTVTSTGVNMNYGVNAGLAMIEDVTINVYGGDFVHTSTADGKEIGAVILNNAGAEFNLFGGTIGRAQQNTAVVARNLYVSKGAQFNMYGGTIRNAKNAQGGNVELADGGIMNMYGGRIENGYSTYRGGNIFAGGRDTGACNTFNMYGGTITGGTALRGGNVGMDAGEFHIYGGTIENGLATGDVKGANNGGNLYNGTDNTVNTISGGTLVGGQAAYGGNLYVLKCEIQITGGTIENGTATTAGGDIYVKENAKLYVTGVTYDADTQITIQGEAKLTDTTIEGTIVCEEKHNVYLYGSTTVNTIDVAETMGAVRGMENWSGTANVINLPENTFVRGQAQSDATSGRYVFVQSGTGYTECGGRFTVGELKLPIVKVVGGALHIGAVAKVAGKDITWFNTMEKALENYSEADFEAGKYLQVFVGTAVTLNGGNYYIDATGYDMTVTGSGKLYAMDSDNSEDFEGFGSWTVTGNVEIVRDFTAPDGNRYLVITKDGVTSAHALVLRLSGVAINTTDAGLYYEAQYKCDDTIAKMISAYGIIASLRDMPGAKMDSGDERTELHTFKPNWNHEVLSASSTVYNIFKDGRTAEKNAQFGQMKIYANPYIELKLEDNGETIMIVADVENEGKKTGEKAWSLYDALKHINDNWDQFAGDRLALRTFYEKWADEGMSEYADDLDKIIAAEGSKVETPLTWTEIDKNAGESATMTAAERRAEALRFMRAMMSFAWTPNVDTVYQNRETDDPYTFESGTVYGGTPYVTNTQGNLYTMMEFYDENTGILNLSGGMDTIKMFSNQCSGSVYWAWQRVAPSAKFISTASMVEENGCLRVGDYVYDTSIKDFYGLKLQNEDGVDYATDYIIVQNGVEKMYQCYAQLQPADGLVTFIAGNNHARMVSGVYLFDANGNPVDKNGAIDPNKSYVTYIDQSGVISTQANKDGVILIGDHDVKKTFVELIDEGYIPFTFAEFQHDQDEKLKSEVTFTVTNGTEVTVAQLAEATVSSNYGISDVTYEIYDADEELAYRELHITFPTLDLRNNSFKLGTEGMMNADALEFFADGEHTIKISVRIGSGEKPVVFEGKLVG